MSRPTHSRAVALSACAGSILILAVVATGAPGSNSVGGITPTSNANQLAGVLTPPGTGITVLGATLVAHTAQGSDYSAGIVGYDLGFGTPRSVLLCNGSAADADQPYTGIANSYHSAGGNALLESVENDADPDDPPSLCRDATVLTVDLLASCGTTEVTVEFMAGTEEGPTNPAYDDTAIIWVESNLTNGNVGLIGGNAISVNTINWIANPPPHTQIAYNNQTAIHQAVIPVIPGEPLTITFGIGDFSGSVDHGWLDSGLIIANLRGNEGTNPCPTDTNDDEITGLPDLLAILSNWGPCCGCPGDSNGDAAIGLVDLLAVLNAWGPCPPPPGT